MGQGRKVRRGTETHGTIRGVDDTLVEEAGGIGQAGVSQSRYLLFSYSISTSSFHDVAFLTPPL